MDTQIVAVFCLVDDMLKGFHHQENQQCVMSDAEVMTIAIIAALYFGGNYTKSCKLLYSQGYIPRMLSKSRFSRRLHRIKPFFLTLFSLLGEHWKSLNEDSIYSIDTFPISACDNYRIPRSKLYQGKQYHGYQASKKRYFYGLKLHLMVTQDGQPVELFLTPGSCFDGTGLYWFDFDLPKGAQVVGDKAYNNYEMEDVLAERVVGQGEAVAAVSKAVRRSRAGLQDPNRPMGSFIFLGPTGVGKTELTKALADYLFDDDSAMVSPF